MTGPAEQSAELWRLGLGIVAIVCAMVLMSSGLNVVLFQLVTSGEAAESLSRKIVAGQTPVAVLVTLGSIGLMAIAAFVATELVHKRSGLTLLGPVPLAKRHIRDVLPGLVVVMCVALALAVWAIDAPLQPGLPVSRWLLFLPLTVFAVLLQTASEEILFRGYLQSQLGAMTRNPLIWMGLPSCLFALLHWSPGTYGDNAIWAVLFAGYFGVLAADLTARSGNLGAAIAMHFINNFGAFALVAPDEDLSGLALKRYPFGIFDESAVQALFPIDFLSVFAFWLVCRIALRR